jgi:hypothetical protein
MGGCTQLMGQRGCIDLELGSKLEDDIEKCDLRMACFREPENEVIVQVLPRTVS